MKHSIDLTFGVVIMTLMVSTSLVHSQEAQDSTQRPSWRSSLPERPTLPPSANSSRPQFRPSRIAPGSNPFMDIDRSLKTADMMPLSERETIPEYTVSGVNETYSDADIQEIAPADNVVFAEEAEVAADEISDPDALATTVEVPTDLPIQSYEASTSPEPVLTASPTESLTESLTESTPVTSEVPTLEEAALELSAAAVPQIAPEIEAETGESSEVAEIDSALAIQVDSAADEVIEANSIPENVLAQQPDLDRDFDADPPIAEEPFRFAPDTTDAYVDSIANEQLETTNPQFAIAEEPLTTLRQTALLDNALPQPLVANLPADAAGRNPPKLLKSVQPFYPRRAFRNNVEGWVIVEFSVDPNGNVVRPEVVRSKPEFVFNRVVLRALKKWSYERRPDNPDAGIKRHRTRFTFNLSE